jgi:hypothetical protein
MRNINSRITRTLYVCLQTELELGWAVRKPGVQNFDATCYLSDPVRHRTSPLIMRVMNMSRTSLYRAKNGSRVLRFANISPSEYEALHDLRAKTRAGNIVIRKADKSRQTVIMGKTAYAEAVLGMLNSASYSKVAFNGKFKCAALIIQAVKHCKSALSKNETSDL